MSRLVRALRKFSGLSARERRVLALACGVLPTVHALQQRLPFRVWRRLLDTDLPSRAPKEGEPSVSEISWSVQAARNWLPGTYRCLPSAYAVHLMLHRYGYPSAIHVGVARDPKGGVEAHAWVECQGRTVIGEVEDLARFTPLPPLRPVAR